MAPYQTNHFICFFYLFSWLIHNLWRMWCWRVWRLYPLQASLARFDLIYFLNIKEASFGSWQRYNGYYTKLNTDGMIFEHCFKVDKWCILRQVIFGRSAKTRYSVFNLIKFVSFRPSSHMPQLSLSRFFQFLPLAFISWNSFMQTGYFPV